MMIYDFTSDYLPPAPALIPYAREQNEAMKRFAAVWNGHYASQPERHIQPPKIRFVEPKADLDELTKHDLNIETVKGDWPINWAYYDEPGHREALRAGREGHNLLLGAERLDAGLSQFSAACIPTRGRRSSKPGGQTAGPTTGGVAIRGQSLTRSMRSPT